MNDTVSGLDPVAALAGEYAERYRRGERPSVNEYAERYPELAAQIRDLFPALVAMEELGSVEGAADGGTGTVRSQPGGASALAHRRGPRDRRLANRPTGVARPLSPRAVSVE